MFRYSAVIICFFICCLHNEIYGLRQFHSGRRSGGNVGSAGNQSEQFYAKLIEDNWFEQNLDHFDPTNTKTWKQVNILIHFGGVILYIHFIAFSNRRGKGKSPPLLPSQLSLLMFENYKTSLEIS